jgi:hypothetical protein
MRTRTGFKAIHQEMTTMKTSIRKAVSLACIMSAAVAMGTLAGCSSHYKVTDPASGKVFYTTSIDQSKKGGWVEFKDAKTDSKITLQSSQVQKISKDEFEQATGKK